MAVSLWDMNADVWAVCDGAGPVPLRSLIILRNGGWRIDNEGASYFCLKAAAIAAGFAVSEMRKFLVEKKGELRAVITHDEVIARLRSEGWSTKGKPVDFDCVSPSVSTLFDTRIAYRID